MLPEGEGAELLVSSMVTLRTVQNVNSTYDILQAIGLGLAFGLRPLAAPFLVALLALGGAGIDLNGTPFHFIDQAPGLIVFAVIAVVGLALDLRSSFGKGNPIDPRITLILALALGALFGAASESDHSGTWWPGAIVGLLSAALGWAATNPLVTGARARVKGEREASLILPLAVELIAILTALASVLVPPLAIVALIATLVLLVRGRRSRSGRYAGLRSLSK